MKKVFLFTFCVFISLSVFSQKFKAIYPYEKEKFSFSVEPGFGLSNSRFLYSLTGTVGYFPVTNLLVGLTATQIFSGNINSADYLSNSIGIFGKYYFGSYRLKPWISTGIDFKSVISEDFNKNEFIVPVALGLDFAINNRISLELGVCKNFSFKSSSNTLNLYPMMGIRIRI